MSQMTLTSPGLAQAINRESYVSHVPNFVLAGMYESGFQGDPHTLATTLQHWYSSTGGTSWINALAAYHAGSIQGQLDPHAQSYAKQVIASAQNAPQSLLGAMSTADTLGLAGAELAGGILGIGGAAAAAGDAAIAADATATAGATAGGSTVAGQVARGAASGAAGDLAKGGLAGLLGAGAWAEFGIRALEALAGAALILLGLQALTGGSGNPIEAVKTTARRMR